MQWKIAGEHAVSAQHSAKPKTLQRLSRFLDREAEFLRVREASQS